MPDPYPAPDGGYSWVVLAGNFIISVIFIGTTKSTGFIFQELVNQNPGVTLALLSWIPAMIFSLNMMLGEKCQIYVS